MTHFMLELEKLGKTDHERAKRLGIPRRTLMVYKSGKFPRIIKTLCNHPTLLRALAEDAEEMQKKPAL